MLEPGYLVIGAGTQGRGEAVMQGGDVTREQRMLPSHVRSSRVSCLCLGSSGSHGSVCCCVSVELLWARLHYTKS